MKKFLIASLLVFFLSLTVQAANLYIAYDPACMDRLEYAYPNNPAYGPYVVYQVNPIPGEKIILEVGQEAEIPLENLPAQFIRCNSNVFGEQFVNGINSKIDKVFIVLRKGENHYVAYAIINAARYLRAEDFILYDSPKYRFQFDLRMGTIGEDIALRNSRAAVFFEARIANDCSGAYVFQQNAKQAPTFTSLVLVPEVGIVEESTGANLEDALKNPLKLQTVNGQKLDDYMKKICKGIEPPPAPAESVQPSGQATAPSNEFITIGAANQPTGNITVLTAKSGDSGTAPSATAQYHTVAKGETLFRISKKYGVTVAQLQEWNNKGKSTTIIKGEKLQVSPTAATPPPQEGIVAVLPQSTESSGTAATGTLQSKGVLTATSSGSKLHIVAPGETVASIAMRYGYTEARFREFNNLGRYDVPKIGQTLKASDCNCPEVQPSIYSTQSSGYTYSQPTTGTELTARTPQGTALPTEMGYTGATAGTQPFSEDAFSRSSNDQYINTPYFLDRLIAPSTTSASQPAQSYSSTGGRIYDTGSPASASQPTYQGSQAPLNLPLGYSNTSSRPSTTPKTGERSFYIVQEGDTLFRIARMYGISVEHLRSVNNLGATEVIIPYQKIYLN